jgi:hypothetical protein
MIMPIHSVVRTVRNLLMPLALLMPLTGIASEGVIEINQAAALAGSIGGAASDAPGFPVTIAESGSYRLTGNLDLPDLNTTAIEVAAHDVSIDLNGFVIRQRESCRPDCGGAAGSGMGIDADQRENIVVKNGTLIGMGSTSIRTGDDASVIEVRALGSGAEGFVMGNRSTVRNALVDGAGGRGITMGSGGAVFDSLVRNAGAVGIFAGQGSMVSRTRVTGSSGHGIEIDGRQAAILDNLVTNNANYGIFSKDGIFARNVVSGNPGFGLFLLGGDGAVVSENLFSENGSGVDVASTTAVLLRANTIRESVNHDLNSGTHDAFSENLISVFGRPLAIISPLSIGPNACNGSLNCP